MEPDNDVDAETGEEVQAPAPAPTDTAAPSDSETVGEDISDAGATPTPNLPAPVAPSVAPDNDVSAE